MADYCFILSWERPLYLWATLYSLYHNTRKPLNFVLVDNNSQDPLVEKIVRGFDRRGMFSDVLMHSENVPLRTQKTFNTYRDKLGDFFYRCNNDVLVPAEVCWASNYEAIYRSHANLGMIGSVCEPDDFLEPEQVQRLFPELTEREKAFYSKLNSPERRVTLDLSRDADKGDFANPPGRLTLLDSAAIATVGFHRDRQLAQKLTDAGYDWTITTGFRHRHLSLSNIFDYPPEESQDYMAAHAAYYQCSTSRGLLSRMKSMTTFALKRLR